MKWTGSIARPWKLANRPGFLDASRLLRWLPSIPWRPCESCLQLLELFGEGPAKMFLTWFHRFDNFLESYWNRFRANCFQACCTLPLRARFTFTRRDWYAWPPKSTIALQTVGGWDSGAYKISGYKWILWFGFAQFFFLGQKRRSGLF